MSDLDWESQNIEGPPKILVLAEEWKDEEAIEDVKDNWDDDEEVEEEEKISETVPAQPIKHNQNNINSQPKAFKVKEETHKVAPNKASTVEEQLAEKMRLQKLAEDADYEIARDMFGLEGISKASTMESVDRLSTASLVSSTNAHPRGQPSPSISSEAQGYAVAQADIESYLRSALREGCPSITLSLPNNNNRSDYEKFAGALKGLLASIKDSPHFHYLAEEIIRYICFQISATDVKKLSIMMDAVSLEKLKTKQVDKKKKPVAATGKGKKLPTLKKTSEQDYDNYMAPEHYDDYDDMF